MTIIETQNPQAPALKRPKFVVDYPLKSVCKPFPDVASYMVFCGKSRSGKSSLLASLLLDKNMYRRAFHNVLIVIPLHSFTSMAEKDNPFAELDENKVFHELDLETLETILHQIEGYADQGEDTLLIIDDFAAELKDRKLLRLLKKMINNRRHERLSIWMSVQTYKSIPLSNRKTINYLVLFKPSNMAEQKAVWEELTLIPRDKFDEICDHVFDRQHEYLVIDRDHDQYWRGFNQLFWN
jgi:hypothetical protein